MTPPRTTCRNCDAPLLPRQRLASETFCGPSCRRSYSALPPGRTCSICGRPVSPRDPGAGVCADQACRVRSVELKRARARREREALRERARALRDGVKAVAVDEPETYWPTPIPYNGLPVTPLPESRKQAFRENLRRLIAEAVARLADAGSESPSPPEGSGVEPDGDSNRPLLGRACGVCRGTCCTWGGVHSYLDVSTMVRQLSRQPARSPDEVREEYEACLGEVTVEGSCVLHGPEGCTLPRHLRSDLCNRFFCDDLIEFRLTGQPRAFLMGVRDDTVRAAAFCDDERTLTIDLPTDRVPAADSGENGGR